MTEENWQEITETDVYTDWSKLLGSKCLIMNYPCLLIEGNGIIREVTILDVTPDNKYVTFEYEAGFETRRDDGDKYGIKQRVNWQQAKRIGFLGEVGILRGRGKYLITHKSYADMPHWRNSLSEVTILGTSVSGDYIKCMWIRTDDTKNIKWEKKEEIILKYKINEDGSVTELGQ